MHKVSRILKTWLLNMALQIQFIPRWLLFLIMIMMATWICILLVNEIIKGQYPGAFRPISNKENIRILINFIEMIGTIV